MKSFLSGPPSKKAQDLAMSQFGKYILIIASFVVILIVMGALLRNVTNGTPEQVCRASTVLNDKVRANLGVAKVDHVYPIQCTTQKVELPVSDVPPGADPSLVKEIIMEDVAELTAKCWWMFGNGEFHNLFDDKAGNDQLCHVCYAFIINEKYKNILQTEPVKRLEFLEYLSTHTYSPGLLISGNSVFGESTYYVYTKQSVTYSISESRQISTKELVASRRLIDRNVVDLTDIYENQGLALVELKNRLEAIDNMGIDVTLVIAPVIPEDQQDDDDNLAQMLIEEWELGTEGSNNALIFIFALNEGKLYFGSQMGAAAIVRASDVDALLEQRFQEYIDQNEPQEAITVFVEDLYNWMTGKDSEEIRQKLLFQQSYMAYITGGSKSIIITDDWRKNKNLDLFSQGAIKISDRAQDITAGQYYGVSYISNVWNGCNLFGASFCKNREVPNMIGISEYEELLTDGRVCNINEE